MIANLYPPQCYRRIYLFGMASFLVFKQQHVPYASRSVWERLDLTDGIIKGCVHFNIPSNRISHAVNCFLQEDSSGLPIMPPFDTVGQLALVTGKIP